MSHLVSLSTPIPGAHTVKLYEGFGIKGADVPSGGDSGGSPTSNDGLNPAAEYHWRIESLPASGVLTVYPNLTFDFQGASDGAYSFTYRLYEYGVSQGTATVTLEVGVQGVVYDVSSNEALTLLEAALSNYFGNVVISSTASGSDSLVSFTTIINTATATLSSTNANSSTVSFSSSQTNYASALGNPAANFSVTSSKTEAATASEVASSLAVFNISGLEIGTATALLNEGSSIVLTSSEVGSALESILGSMNTTTANTAVVSALDSTVGTWNTTTANTAAVSAVEYASTSPELQASSTEAVSSSSSSTGTATLPASTSESSVLDSVASSNTLLPVATSEVGNVQGTTSIYGALDVTSQEAVILTEATLYDIQTLFSSIEAAAASSNIGTQGTYNAGVSEIALAINDSIATAQFLVLLSETSVAIEESYTSMLADSVESANALEGVLLEVGQLSHIQEIAEALAEANTGALSWQDSKIVTVSKFQIELGAPKIYNIPALSGTRQAFIRPAVITIIK